MKLFEISYMDDYETYSYLAVGNSEEEVEERESKKLEEELSCFMNFWIGEIKEVDGYKIIVE